ncbi:UvrABC system protein C [Rubripirellula lacrimiformis]|uniref:UvrABC system protein C n=1 Tax=Rubripirellula lacrimiformis TaxID=1930273 RepID=A0A517NFL4_9BACT|nr:GIY-YIG nuclease family protein [Rubripirellula lacrimiformis]QDT05922.1 UvrABC system protein C [Rubripirellula lacrimiformis]
MDALFGEQPIFGFGPDPLSPHPTRPIDAVGDVSTIELKRRVIQSCPRVPGVYGMLDRKGQLIYVGKSKSLRSRLLSYFAASNSKEKGGRIIEAARAIQWETQPSEFAALVREQQLIRRFTPRWNVQGVPKRQRPVYLCLGKNPAMFFTSAKPPESKRDGDMVAVEGPFFGAGRMKTAVDTLNKVFQLRDCGSKQVFRFADQLQLFDLEYRPGCLRLEVGSCLGPCAAACSRLAYDERVHAAESFLDGFNHEPLDAIELQMKTASANQQYELAARSLLMVKSLKYIDRKLKMLNQARRRYTFIYAVPGHDGCGTWYLIHCGEIADAVAAPRNASEYAQLSEKLKHWAAVSTSRLDRGHGAFPHTLSLVASWFRKNRDELDFRTFPAHKAQLPVPSKATAARS